MQDPKSHPGDELRSGHTVKAFHGTTLERAMNILRVGFQKALGVCGVGAYFDIGASRSAVERAIEKSENPLEARILEVELHPGDCIDWQAPDVKAVFQSWQSSYRLRIGEETFRKTRYNTQKETCLIEQFLHADSATLIDEDGNRIIGMRNTKMIRILQVRLLTKEEIAQYEHSRTIG